ncbi:MerR family DNA-binding protein [Salinicola peritrichatus]|uniref:MerR family DNA-binding protein n=1 Tax=Salinicola peritrichatus TaxID=1267424 RepID=UPI000DA1F80C|nr:MerR family DNA-binding protein [Salinicola peritrichatus]
MKHHTTAARDHFTIGQLATLTGTKPVTIRYYERTGLLSPANRSAAGYRLYTPNERDRLDFIRRCRRLGLGLDEVRALLRLSDDRAAPCRQVDAIIHRQLEQVRERIRDLQSLERELERLELGCQAETVEACKIIEALSRRDEPTPV